MKKMERFLLFGYDDYYPQGADNDVVGSFDTMEEVRAAIVSEKMPFQNYAVLDLQERIWVKP
jgi:hypothetical protein